MMIHDHKLANQVIQLSLLRFSFKFVLLPQVLEAMKAAEFSLQKVSLELRMGWHPCC